MLKLVPLISVCVFLAIIADRRSTYDEVNEKYIHKDIGSLVIIGCIISIFAGLRLSYNDTAAYYDTYKGLTVGHLFDGVDLTLAKNPGFRIVENLMKICRLSPQSFIMATSIFCMGISIWFIGKYSENITLSIFLFFMTSYFGFTMGAIRQSLAIAICLLAIDCQMKRKYLLFFALVLLAMTFHSFALVFFASPFLEFRPWSLRAIIAIVIFVIVGISLQTWMGSIVDVANLMGEQYDTTILVGNGVNIFRVGVTWAPIILSVLTLRYWVTSTNREQNIIVNLTVLNAGLMFIALFGNPIYFGRLANYFLIFQTLSLPIILKCFEKRSRLFIIGLVVVFYLGYAYYDNVLNGRSFDDSYRSVGILYYLDNIFY